jgi:hypothetical protein
MLADRRAQMFTELKIDEQHDPEAVWGGRVAPTK